MTDQIFDDSSRPVLADLVPGSAIGMIGATLAALLDSPADAPVVARLWDVVERGGLFDEALGELGSEGFSGLPPLVLVGWAASTARVVLRGNVEAAVLDEQGEEIARLLGGEVHSWAEHSVHGAARVQIGRQLPEGQVAHIAGPFRLERGLVPADALDVPMPAARPGMGSGMVEVPVGLLGVAETDPVANERPAPGAETESVADPEPDLPPHPEPNLQPDTDDDAAPADLHDLGPFSDDLVVDLEEGEEGAVMDGASSSADVVDVPDGSPSDMAVDGPPVVGSEAAELSPPAVAVPPPTAVPPPPPVGLAKTPAVSELLDEPVDATILPGGVPETGDDYDSLFGATEFRSVEAAAVRPVDAEAENAAVEGALADDEPVDADHDGRTMTIAEIQRLRGAQPIERDASVVGGEGRGRVLAVRCQRGHLNPPHAHECRSCGGEIFTQQPIRLDHLSLGTLTFSTGAKVNVTGPLLVGRSPKLSGALHGKAPELISVPSPGQDISRTHMEVRVEGWRVMVADLGSTNGTVVTLPGRSPQRLRPDEPFPLTPGAVVSLADEVEFTFEVDT